MEITLTKEQKKNAHRVGLTYEEARKLIMESNRDEKLDRKTYDEMSEVERDAHDNF